MFGRRPACSVIGSPMKLQILLRAACVQSPGEAISQLSIGGSLYQRIACVRFSLFIGAVIHNGGVIVDLKTAKSFNIFRRARNAERKPSWNIINPVTTSSRA